MEYIKDNKCNMVMEYRIILMSLNDKAVEIIK